MSKLNQLKSSSFLLLFFRANSRIAEIQRSKSAEIAKLTALLRKAEMRVSSLERSVEQKVKHLKPVLAKTNLSISVAREPGADHNL